MKRIFAALVIFVIFTIGGITTVFADEIEWELKQPFRFFKYRSDFEIHRWAYESLKPLDTSPEPTVLDIEHVLNDDPDWWTKPLPAKVAERFKKPATTTPLELLTALRADEIRNEHRLPGYLELMKNVNPRFTREYDFRRLGWASLLFPAHQEQTFAATQDPALVDAQNVAVCWNRAEQRYSNCPNYVLPKSHALLLHLSKADAAALGSATCAWRLDAGSGSAFAAPNAGTAAATPCDQTVEVQVPSKMKLAGTLEAPGRPPINFNIDAVNDVLVVGLGDSFSSGEGNPDVPAKMRWGSQSQDPLIQDSQAPLASDQTWIPLRKADGDYFAAQWIDRACHRSAYSYQLRAALYLAVKDPHRAITFLSYACSGAEINEGLFNPYMGPEFVTGKSRMAPFERAQIPLLLAELCEDGRYNGDAVRSAPLTPAQEDALIKGKSYVFRPKGGAASDAAYRCGTAPLGQGLKRPIDLLFISIGGNDAGFGRWITAAISPPSFWRVADAFLPVLDSDKSACKADGYSCKAMTERWGHVPARYALLRDFLDKRLQYGSGGAKGILVYTYPVSDRDQNGELCHSGSSGMTVWAYKSICLKKDYLLPSGTLAYVENFAKTRLKTAVADFAEGIGTANQYTVVSDYADEIGGHGFCSTKAPEEPQDRCYSFVDLNDLAAGWAANSHTIPPANETLHVPRFLNEQWLPFDPVLGFNPYRHRSRWARTMNDVYVLINQNNKATRLDTTQVLLSFTKSAVYGAFHPTAEAHARVASSFAAAAEPLLPHQ